MSQRTLRGLFWMFLGTGGQALVQIGALVILARLLKPEDFGLVAAALVVIGFSAIFSQLGIGPAVVQRPNLQPAHLRTGFTLTLLLSFFLTGLFLLTAPAIAAFFRRDDLTDALRVLALVFPIQGLSVVAESLLQRELRFRLVAGLELAAAAFGPGLVGIVLAFLGCGVWALVAGYLAQATLKTVLFLWLQPHPKRPQLDGRACKELVYFGGGFTAARVCNFLAVYGDKLVVGRWLGPVSLGIYGQAYQLMVTPATLFGQVLDRVLFPAMARVQGEPDKLAAAYRRGVALIALVVVPASVFLFFLAPEAIRVLLGPQWDGVVAPLQVLCAGMLFRTSYKMSDSLVRATGAVYRRAWRQALYAFLVITGAVAGQLWGLSGVAVGVTAALAVNFLLMAHLSLQLTGLSWRSFAAAHVPGLALGLLVGAIGYSAAEASRALELAPPLVLLASAAALLPCLLLVRGLPNVFLGREGLWIFRTLTVSRAQ